MAKHSFKDFNPVKIADLETRMWRSYYGHHFVKLFVQLTQLFRYQFGVNFLVVARLSYHSGRAATIFRKSEDLSEVRHYLNRYYELIFKYAAEPFDSDLAARTELKWWLIHRYPNKYKESLSDALDSAIAAFYNIEQTDVGTYGVERAKAMNIRDEATHKYKVEPDWVEINNHLKNLITHYQNPLIAWIKLSCNPASYSNNKCSL